MFFLNVSLSWLFGPVTRNALVKRAKSCTLAQEHTLENYQQSVTISLFQVCADFDAGPTFGLFASFFFCLTFLNVTFLDEKSAFV